MHGSNEYVEDDQRSNIRQTLHVTVKIWWRTAMMLGGINLIVTSYELLSLDLATRKIEYIDDLRTRIG